MISSDHFQFHTISMISMISSKRGNPDVKLDFFKVDKYETKNEKKNEKSFRIVERIGKRRNWLAADRQAFR
jgi:hypothetical protein